MIFTIELHSMQIPPPTPPPPPPCTCFNERQSCHQQVCKCLLSNVFYLPFDTKTVSVYAKYSFGEYLKADEPKNLQVFVVRLYDV